MFKEASSLGVVTLDSNFKIQIQDQVLADISTQSLKETWRTPIC